MTALASTSRHDLRRIAALRALDLGGDTPDGFFDALAGAAAMSCEAPIAFVILVDEHRQWFKGSAGVPRASVAEGRCVFSGHLVATGKSLVVPDASRDARFADHPLVTGPKNMQSYAGAPIRAGRGVTLGALCVIDHVPRQLARHQLSALRHLAGAASQVLESRARLHRTPDREVLQVMLEAVTDAVLSTDAATTVQWMNPAAEQLTGWSTIEAVGRPLAEIFAVFDEATRTFAPNPVDLCLGRAAPLQASERLVLVARDGRETGIDGTASAIRDASQRVVGAVLTFRDASEQRRSAHHREHGALHDALTGLPNWSAFESELAEVLAKDAIASHVLLYLDLDRFKFVNDACGHAAGDQLLRQIGGIVRSGIRADDRLARLGGDEFGVLLAHCDVEHARGVAQKICDQLDDFRFVHQGRRFRIGASIGLVPLAAGWPNVTALLQAADASCHAAKEGGRNRVSVWEPTDLAVATRQGEMQWVSRIELALDEDRFELHGQRIAPIAADTDGLHFEVLLRMREDDGTLTLPGAFLPVAERFHFATRIDRWVMRKAFDWMTQAAQRGIAIELMAVNLSGQTLGDRTFRGDLLDLIRSASFDVGRLCLEITETAAITHLTDARAFIEDVRALGVKIALDDFGAGASSFGYLRSLPVDYLKIDGRFITNLLDDPIDNAAVRCFCEVARVMGIQTIAEFVERQAVRDELRAIGVDLAQGYLIHAPEPLADLLAHASPEDRPILATGTDRPSMTRGRRVTEVPFDLPNPNRLDLADPSELLLWADDLSITAERLQEIVGKVGPMRAAIRAYVMAQRRAAGRPGHAAHDDGCGG